MAGAPAREAAPRLSFVATGIRRLKADEEDGEQWGQNA